MYDIEEIKRIKSKLEKGLNVSKEALLHFKKALELKPDIKSFKKAFGNCFNQIKKAEEALEHCNIILSTYNKNEVQNDIIH